MCLHVCLFPLVTCAIDVHLIKGILLTYLLTYCIQWVALQWAYCNMLIWTLCDVVAELPYNTILTGSDCIGTRRQTQVTELSSGTTAACWRMQAGWKFRVRTTHAFVTRETRRMVPTMDLPTSGAASRITTLARYVHVGYVFYIYI